LNESFLRQMMNSSTNSLWVISVFFVFWNYSS